MALTEPYSGTNNAWGTEYSLTNASTVIASRTTAGVYQLFLDLNALAIGDVYRVRVYEKTRTADTQRVCYEAFVSNVQGAPIFTTPPLHLLNGWDFAVYTVSGTNSRAIPYSIRMAA